MTSYRRLFWLLALVGSIACHPTQKSVETPTTTTTTSTPSTPDSEIKIPKKVAKPHLKSVLLSHQRGSCFGKCPVFKLDIGTDGTAIYTGIAHVSRLGTYTTKLPTDGVKMIQDKAKAIGFFEFNTQYPSKDAPALPDLPQSNTTFRSGGKEHKVTVLYDGPQSLAAFQQWLENYIDGLDWVKVDE